MNGKFDGLGRFADPSLLILTSLSDGPKHGYAIMTDITAFSGIGMEPGTLYGALSRP
jgi:DNA-binding PadR family transcriptional regulator